MDIYSDTSILGAKLKNLKPLHRGFALVRDAIEHMSDDLWKSMPVESDFPVSHAAAEEFYQANFFRGNKVMQHLHEHSKPKTTLTDEQCSEIVSIALLTESHTKSKRANILSKWMQSYINTDPILKEYANSSPENYGCLQFSIYRIALERYAHQLGRHIFEVCAELFYYPLSKATVDQMWKSVFTSHLIDRVLKQEVDPIHIRNMQLPSRNFYLLYSNEQTGQYYKEVNRFARYPYTLVLQGTDHQHLQPILQGERKARIFFEPTPTYRPVYKNTQDLPGYQQNIQAYLDSIQNAIDSGFDGIKVGSILIDEIPISEYCPWLYIGRVSIKEYVERLLQIYQPYCELVKQIRLQIGNEYPFIFSVYVPNNWHSEIENPIRTICRWLADDGVDMIDLEPIHDAMPIERLPYLCDSLNEAIPIPILIGCEKLPQSPDKLLQQHAVTGFLCHHLTHT